MELEKGSRVSEEITKKEVETGTVLLLSVLLDVTTVKVQVGSVATEKNVKGLTSKRF